MSLRPLLRTISWTANTVLNRSLFTSAVPLSRKKLGRPVLPYSVVRRSAGMADLAEERYRHHNRKQLLQRIEALESALNAQSQSDHQAQLTSASTTPSKLATKQARPFDITRYPCRKIALRFAYDGEAYSGLEMQSNSGRSDEQAIETVESVLWQALSDARLVDPKQTLQDVGWSRCGRTDRGVSAAGQVVALWVRSRRVNQWKERRASDRLSSGKEEDLGVSSRRGWHMKASARLEELLSNADSEQRTDTIEADADAEELPYVMSLNRLLPPTIQVQAWSPVDPLFNARFDCQYRHYKYFFTAGAPFVSQPSVYGPQPRLDIGLMRQAAQRLLGEHDFRNFCKVDPSKQLVNFFRRIDGVSIDPVDDIWRPTPPKERQVTHTHQHKDAEQIWVLNLRGTAFLYHQVRNIVAILFLVGSKLEKPEIVDELLNVQENGVYVDRLVSAAINGLHIHDEEIQTIMPPSSACGQDEKLDLTQTYQRLRQRADASSEQEMGLSQDVIDTLAPLKSLMTYERKPVFEMALDRPLMLWECGFRRDDVEWRSGTYDGKMSDSAIRKERASLESISAPSKVSQALMHATWSAQTITAEIYRHLTLAHPSDPTSSTGQREAGFIPASTDFLSASFPALVSASIGGCPETCDKSFNTHGRDLIPLGYGKFKTMPKYAPLRTVARQLTPTEKNAKWQSTKGQRRTAARLKAAAEE